MNRPALLIIGAIAAVVAVVFAVSWMAPSGQKPADKPPTGATAPQITDLDIDAAALLRTLPGVAAVQVKPAVGKTTGRIIHLVDLKRTPRANHDFSFELATGKKATEDDYDNHLLSVKLVQENQRATLNALIGNHGLRYVSIENITEEDLPSLPVKLAAIKEAGKNRGELIKQLKDVRAMLAKAEPGSERHAKLLAIETEVAGLQAAFRRDRLDWGLPYSLDLDGRLDTVLPLDDKDALAAAKPVKVKNGIQVDYGLVAKRMDAIVKNAMKPGRVAVIVASGLNNVHAAILRVDDGIEYVQVSGPAYLTAIGAK